MKDTQYRRKQDGTKGKPLHDEWQGIVDRIEEAIVISMANKVLENATFKEKQVEESRRKLRLVELKEYPRRKSIGEDYE
jgi:hypothetical protein